MISKQRIAIVSTIMLLFVIGFSESISAQVNFTASELIGRVSDNSITINVETDTNLMYYFEYGSETGVYSNQIPVSGSLTSIANSPFEIKIDNLSPNMKYYYRLVYSSDNGNTWIERDEHSFHTSRPKGSDFVFTVTSDSHQGSGVSNPILNLYLKTLSNVISDDPDLHFDIGDSFSMTNVELGDNTSTKEEYLSQRSSLSTIGHSVPLYLIIGNHEDEEGWNLDDSSDVSTTKPIMSTNARKKYFLNPIPDDFYSGNSNNSQAEIIEDHLRENYFSFEWGDALFIGIDPYWNTMKKPYSGTAGGEENDEVVGDRWDWTLGEEQYLWLKETLETSNAKWKFVFSHQVAGGTSDYGRGGAEATTNYEWGANEADFVANRPNWTYSTSIHQLMLNNNATIFFHGHDHIFAKEEIDGMVYQECPQPTDLTYGPGFGNYTNNDSTVVVINNSGHLRVSVSPTEVTVDYIRAYLPAAGNNGRIAHSYTIESTETIISQKTKSALSFHIYPNPTTANSKIEFTLPAKQNVLIKVTDNVGNEVAELVNCNMNAGTHKLNFDTSLLDAGQYFVKIETGGHSEVTKIISLK